VVGRVRWLWSEQAGPTAVSPARLARSTHWGLGHPSGSDKLRLAFADERLYGLFVVGAATEPALYGGFGI